MSTHLPIRILRPLHRQCLLRRVDTRPFSTTPARLAPRNRRQPVDRVQIAAATRYQGGKASSTDYESQLEDERNLPDDIGILPGTFIRKPLTAQIQPNHPRKAPTWFTKAKDRLFYEWKFCTSQVKAWILLSQFKFVLRPCPSLSFFGDRGVVKNLAREKYVHLYRSFAYGDIQAISELCCSGVTEKFRDRIAARPRDMTAEWKLHNDGKVVTTMVSNRTLMLQIPGYEDTGIQQIVFRMQSNQSLRYYGTSGGQRGKIIEYNSKEGPVVEYLVLQRQIIRRVFKEWKVWGFANEWDLDSIEDDAKYEREVNSFAGSEAA